MSLTYSNSQKGWLSTKDKCTRGWFRELGKRFNTAAGIARQSSTEQGENLSRHTVSQRLRKFGLKAHSVLTTPLISTKNHKARLSLAEQYVVRRERRTGPTFTSVMKASLIYLCPMGNIMFGVKLGKDWSPSVQRCQWKVEKEVSWFGGCFMQQELGLIQIHEWMQHNDTEWMQIYQNLLRQHTVPSLHSSMFFVQGVNYRFKPHN